MKQSSLGQLNTNLIFLLATATLVFIEITSAAPHSSLSYPIYYAQEGQNPEYVLRSIARLRQAIYGDEDLENSKRGLDLGLGRGFSGSQAAKHLMGLAAANFAGGPGRRRRGFDMEE